MEICFGDICEEEQCFYSAVESDYKEPKNYRAMLKRPPDEKDEWLKGCKEELDNFENRGVWTRVKIKDIPKNRRLIGNKWVFKKKRDGRFRSRLVALGYTQIPGIDYTDNFSAVVHDVTLRLCLNIWICCGLDIDQMDVETAFLEGELKPDEYQYMKCPEGLELKSDECLEIKRGMYGLVQSSRIFWIRMTNHLTSDKVGFAKSLSDQCLFYKQRKKGSYYLIIICG